MLLQHRVVHKVNVENMQISFLFCGSFKPPIGMKIYCHATVLKASINYYTLGIVDYFIT